MMDKEIEIEVGDITAHLYADYQNGRLQDVVATISALGGWVVTWNNVRHRHGQITLWENGKFTEDWKVAVSLLDKDFMLELRKEIDKLNR